MRTVSKSGALKGTYRYNALGQRTRKEIPNKNSQVFHYDLAGNLIMRSIQTGKPLEDYIWVDGELRQFTTLKGRNNGTLNTERVKTFITTDHLLTPRLGTNDAQTIVWRWDSDAFHIKRPPNDLDGDGTKINLFIGFPGQYYDTESSLYYHWNRYYDRLSGRYVTSDPIGLRGGLNVYLYAKANALKLIDFKGLQFNNIGTADRLFFDGMSDALDMPPSDQNPPRSPSCRLWCNTLIGTVCAPLAGLSAESGPVAIGVFAGCRLVVLEECMKDCKPDDPNQCLSKDY